MDILAQVMEKVNNLFDEKYLEGLAYETGFIKRKRKIDPKKFLEKVIFLRLESPNSSLEDLVYEFYKSATVISKQALSKKFNQSAVRFVEKILDQLLQQAMSEQTLYLEALSFVKNVYVVDSSEIRFNKALKDLFPQVRHQGAAVKLQATMEVLSNQIRSLEVCPSKEPDQGYKDHLVYVQAGDLLIGDLGYFCVDSFRDIQAKEGFFLSRYFKKAKLYDLDTGKGVNLRAILSSTQEEKIMLSLAIGASKLPCRLVAIKLPKAAYQQRLKNLVEKGRRDPRSKVAQGDDILNSWTIFVTNLPLSVKMDIFLPLYSLRWQIELLFKLMKTFLNLRNVDSGNQYRAGVSVYISLICMTLLSFIASTIVDKEISLYKASKVFIRNIRKIFHFISDKRETLSWFRDLLCKFALKDSRRKRPSTKCSLEVNYA